jgi:hypothetical protein
MVLRAAPVSSIVDGDTMTKQTNIHTLSPEAAPVTGRRFGDDSTLAERCAR